MSEALLQLRGVRKSFGQRVALRGVDLDVRRGELVVLLGPNGAGKTTLFALVTGLYAADSGTIAVNGADLARAPIAALAALGVVFQQPTLDLDLSVEANLHFHAALHGMDRQTARQRIALALNRLQLTERSHDRVRALSGGMRRKVELARAQLHQPAALVMDEPTVGLDPASRRQLLDDVLRARADGVGVLWATHLVDEAERADRVAVLHRGELLACGAPAEIADERPLADAFLEMTASAEPAVAIEEE
jgi:ABC-2 type transport system ATP-binding protein